MDRIAIVTALILATKTQWNDNNENAHFRPQLTYRLLIRRPTQGGFGTTF